MDIASVTLSLLSFRLALLMSMKNWWWLEYCGFWWPQENMTACAVAFERGVDDGDASFWLTLDAREALLQGLRGR